MGFIIDKFVLEVLEKSRDNYVFNVMVDQMITNPDAMEALYGDGNELKCGVNENG